jgi:hypothetical protein
VTDSNGEKWLKDYGDPSRCYLYGCGCGGNIVFNTAMQIEDMDLEPLKIGGLVMNQPMFSGEKRTASELRSISFIICIVKFENRNVLFSFIYY